MQARLNRRIVITIITSILCAMFGSTSQSDELRETEQIKLTDRQLAGLPVWATVKLSDPPAADFDIGSVFTHEFTRGRIAVHNDSVSEITFGEINTSCGCAAAVPTDKRIAAGQTAYLIIDYRPGAPGGKSVVIGATISGKRFELVGKSTCLAPFVAEPTVIRVVDGRARVRLKVVDTRIDLDHAKITINPPLFTIASQMSKDAFDFEITATRLPAVLPDTISIIVNDGKERSIDLGVSYPGRFQISPRLLLSSVAMAQEISDKPTDEERWTNRIYEWVADMSANRDDLIKRRYAVLMDGIMIHPNTPQASDGDGLLKVDVINIPYERPFQRIYARDGMNFEYRAYNLVFPLPGPNQQQHQWLEFVRAGKIERGRSLFFNETDLQVPTYVDRPADIALGDWFTKEFSSLKGFTPYDSFVIPFSFLLHGYNPQSAEKILFVQMQLRTVTAQTGGMYVSEWFREQNGGELLLKITHDSSKEWMPTEVSFKSGNGWPENSKVDQYMRLLQWRQIEQFWLPHMVEHSENFNGGDEQISQVVKLQWTVGPKAPDTAFDPKTEDLRQPVLDHFGAEFVRIKNGKVMPPPYYSPPADLLEEFQDEYKSK